jgi:long-chain acyl-CoA synthetase
MSGIITSPSVRSIPGLLRARVAVTPDTEALRHRVGSGWTSTTWAELGDQVRDLALGLIDLGVGERERVAILSGTRVEWIVADLAVLGAAATATTVYPSNTADECAFVLADSGSVVVIAEDDGQSVKLRSVRDRIPAVRHVVVIEGTPSEDGWVVTLAEVVARGRSRDREEYDRIVEGIAPDDLATLIYTSGTTGRPKGVELTHDNWLYTGRAVHELDILRAHDLHFLWLPMSHSFGKMLEVLMIAVGLPTAIDGSVERIAGNLRELRPTIVAAAPRIFEKIYNTAVATVRSEGGVKLALFRWARQVAIESSRANGRPQWTLKGRHALADRLVFAKLRERFGGRVRYFVSGSAPLSPEIAEFFGGAGLRILEGYGLTETSAASFIMRPEDPGSGGVGRPVPGTEVRIAEDGEVLVRSPGVMRAYHGLPEETAKTIVDGWLHTGDIGELDERGGLRLTDRKKELIKTSGGKYVAPQPIEGRIKAACPYLANVLVHGDRRNFCVALVTLDPDTAARWTSAHDQSTESPEFRAVVQKAIDEVNADLPGYSTVKAFAILPEDFAGDEVTASMKIRRRVVEEHHAEVLDAFYAKANERA